MTTTPTATPTTTPTKLPVYEHIHAFNKRHPALTPGEVVYKVSSDFDDKPVAVMMRIEADDDKNDPPAPNCDAVLWVPASDVKDGSVMLKLGIDANNLDMRHRCRILEMQCIDGKTSCKVCRTFSATAERVRELDPSQQKWHPRIYRGILVPYKARVIPDVDTVLSASPASSAPSD